MALIPIFKNSNIVSYNSVDKEEIKLIMICVRTQLFTDNDRLLQNSPSWRQFKIRSADRRLVPCPNEPVYKPYFNSGTLFLLFEKPYQIIARRIEINIILPIKQIFYLFIY